MNGDNPLARSRLHIKIVVPHVSRIYLSETRRFPTVVRGFLFHLTHWCIASTQTSPRVIHVMTMGYVQPEWMHRTTSSLGESSRQTKLNLYVNFWFKKKDSISTLPPVFSCHHHLGEITVSVCKSPQIYWDRTILIFRLQSHVFDHGYHSALPELQMSRLRPATGRASVLLCRDALSRTLTRLAELWYDLTNPEITCEIFWMFQQVEKLNYMISSHDCVISRTVVRAGHKHDTDAKN